MKVVDALIRSAQELLFDAVSDVDVAKVGKCFNIREHHFIFFLQRVDIFVFKESHVDILLRAYRTARDSLSENEDGALVIYRVMVFCSECADISQKC